MLVFISVPKEGSELCGEAFDVAHNSQQLVSSRVWATNAPRCAQQKLRTDQHQEPRSAPESPPSVRAVGGSYCEVKRALRQPPYISGAAHNIRRQNNMRCGMHVRNTASWLLVVLGPLARRKLACVLVDPRI